MGSVRLHFFGKLVRKFSLASNPFKAGKVEIINSFSGVPGQYFLLLNDSLSEYHYLNLYAN